MKNMINFSLIQTSKPARCICESTPVKMVCMVFTMQEIAQFLALLLNCFPSLTKRVMCLGTLNIDKKETNTVIK